MIDGPFVLVAMAWLCAIVICWLYTKSQENVDKLLEVGQQLLQDNKRLRRILEEHYIDPEEEVPADGTR